MNKKILENLPIHTTGKEKLYLEVFNIDGYKVKKFLLDDQNVPSENFEFYKTGYYLRFTV